MMHRKDVAAAIPSSTTAAEMRGNDNSRNDTSSSSSSSNNNSNSNSNKSNSYSYRSILVPQHTRNTSTNSNSSDDDYDFDDAVLRAASRHDFMGRLQQVVGPNTLSMGLCSQNDSGIDLLDLAQGQMPQYQSYRDTNGILKTMIGGRGAGGSSASPVAAVSGASMDCGSSTGAEDYNQDSDASASAPRLSVEMISEILLDYVHKEIELDLEPPKRRRTSAEEVTNVLKNFLQESRDILSLSQQIGGLVAKPVPAPLSLPEQQQPGDFLPAPLSASFLPPSMAFQRSLSSVSSVNSIPSDDLDAAAAAAVVGGYDPSVLMAAAAALQQQQLQQEHPAQHSSFNLSPRSVRGEDYSDNTLTPSGSDHAHSPSSSSAGDYGTRSRKYVCQVCDKAFTNNSNLNRHLRIHTGAKPYQCEWCCLAFNNSSNRRKHEKHCHSRGAFASTSAHIQDAGS